MSPPLRRWALCLALLASLLALPGAATAATASGVQVYLTTPDLSAALTHEAPVTFSSAPLPQGTRVLDVDDHVRYQSVIGFGAAMTDTSAYLLHDFLSAGVRRNVITRLFSDAGSGIGIDFVRVPIGGSDFTAGETGYTYDDLPPGQTDPDLADFSIRHDLDYVIPVLQQMMKTNRRVDIISTQWSPPGWMKANDALDDLGRGGTLLQADYPVLAQYMVKFIRAYAAAGIPIWAVTPENEPGDPVNYPSMNISPANEAKFVAQDLAPAFQAARVTARIYGGDTGAAEPSYSLADQSDGASAAALSGEAWHCYGGQAGITAFHERFSHVQELMTECSPGIIPYTAGEAAIDAMRNWASTATLWNIALNQDGGPVQPPNVGCPNCTALVQVNQGAKTVTYTRNYYELGQLSKFVERGAVRIETPRWVSDYRDATGSHVSDGLDNVAFLNPDGSRVLVAANNSAASIQFGVSWNGQAFAYTLPAGAMVTFRWTGSEPQNPTDTVAPCFNAGVRYVTSGNRIAAQPDCAASSGGS